MGIRLSSGSRPQSPKSLPLHLLLQATSKAFLRFKPQIAGKFVGQEDWISYWTQIADWVLVECLYLVEKAGGDDETRTRDLCRDRGDKARN